MMKPAIKRLLRISILGALILAGCAPAPVHDQAPADLSAAIARARTESKLVLLEFTGSDWCPPCMQLHKEIFSRSEFQAYAGSNLVFVTLDFPRKFQLSADATATNSLLATKFNIEGFPTLIALDGDGKEIWRQVGFFDGGLNTLSAELTAAKSKAK
jgi:thioredoxin-related protein